MNYALLCSCEAKPKQKSSIFYIYFSLFFGRGRGSTYEASPSFTSRFALVTVGDRPSPKPSPTPLHVRCGDIALLTQSVAGFLVKFEYNKFGFSRCRSRRVKFKAEICKFIFKFERKKSRRSILRWI